ncbi:ferredoxin--NADP(+) reductase [Maricurvus nonylphenolicus]|uniref:ferredoxin--NADP reductase n=1 Tax=Maricurvus nonylphenolicus TaxID=1008307 RepID=UPI0036F2D6BA
MDKGQPCTILQRQQWTEDLCTLWFEPPQQPKIQAGQFIRVGLEVEVDGEKEFVARPYSLVNAPTDERWEIYFNRVPDGPLSRPLFDLQEGDQLWATGQGNGFFTLDEVPKAQQLWLIATGTGIGPFLSILQTPRPWQDYQQIVLVHGIKQLADKTYSALLAQLQSQYPGRLQVLYTITRETVVGAYTQRVTEALKSGWLEDSAGLQIGADQTQVMLCGHPDMVREMTGLLQTRGLAKNRRRAPGQITSEIYR